MNKLSNLETHPRATKVQNSDCHHHLHQILLQTVVCRRDWIDLCVNYAHCVIDTHLSETILVGNDPQSLRGRESIIGWVLVATRSC
jgi:hypothetical protein